LKHVGFRAILKINVRKYEKAFLAVSLEFVSLSAAKRGTFSAWEAEKGIRQRRRPERAERAGASESLGRGEVVLRV